MCFVRTLRKSAVSCERSYRLKCRHLETLTITRRLTRKYQINAERRCWCFVSHSYLLAEALDLSFRELFAFIELFNPLIELFRKRLLVHVWIFTRCLHGFHLSLPRISSFCRPIVLSRNVTCGPGMLELLNKGISGGNEKPSAFRVPP